jgi:hypothetical protein
VNIAEYGWPQPGSLQRFHDEISMSGILDARVGDDQRAFTPAGHDSLSGTGNRAGALNDANVE